MTRDLEGIEARFERLAQATERIAPSPHFSARVMEAVGTQRHRDVSTWIARLGRITIPAAAVIATALAFWAVESNGDYQDAVVVASYDMEQDW